MLSEDIIKRWINDGNVCGRNLLKTLNVIQFVSPNLEITDTSYFDKLLTDIKDEEIVILMKTLLPHITDLNFMLNENLTFLQGVIGTRNNELIRLVTSNTHGSKVFKFKVPLNIDSQSKIWLQVIL
jgi:hypothetical protein